MRYILDYQDRLQWDQALTIGAIIAATDPVAVVALLKELGTSIKFNILLEGESLLNDGTATVFFWVFFDSVRDELTVAKLFERFFRLSFGGIFLGLFFGIISYFLLMRILHY